MPANLALPRDKIKDFCLKHKIRRLSLFGSVLREDFRPDSDIDVLVEFEPDARVGLIRMAGMEMELMQIMGRKVDMNTPRCLSPMIRESVLARAEIQYERT